MARENIDYDFEDFGMDAKQLEDKYESLINAGTAEHPVFVRTAYAVYVAMPTRDVKLSYWDWVVAQIKKDDDAMAGATEPSTQAFQNQLTEQEVEDTEFVDIPDVNEFAGHVVNWHTRRMAMLRHFQKMPEGQTVTVTLGGVQSEVELTGDAYKGYQAGLLTAILQFDSLPFAVSVSDAIDSTLMLGDANAPKH